MDVNTCLEGRCVNAIVCIENVNISQCIDAAVSVIWGPWTVALVLFVGAFISIRLGFPQLKVKEWWSATVGAAFVRSSVPPTKQSENTDRGSQQRRNNKGRAGFFDRRNTSVKKVTPFQSATAALAGTLGTGNIVGVAAAMTLGGASAVFWMWIAALFGMATSYAENALGVIYRQKAADGDHLGGPMLYMEKGLRTRWLAVLWAVVCAASALGVGNLTQMNSIAESANAAWGVPPWLSGVSIMLLAAPSILGGVGSVVRVTERLVPVMAGLYMVSCIIVLAINYRQIPGSFAMIFSDLTAPQAVGGGFLGAMLVGVRRGVFTNEAGMGSSVMLHAAAHDTTPELQGQWGMFEVFFDTIVMCTITALTILSSGVMERSNGADGARLSAMAFDSLFGSFSGSFITLCLLLFAFSTIVSWSCCGERAFCYIFGGKYTKYYKLLYVLLIMPGAVLDMRAVWSLSDLFNGLMAIPNIIAVVLLCPELRCLCADGKDRRCDKNRRLIPMHRQGHQPSALSSPRRSFQ